MENKIREEERRLPYPPDPYPRLTAYFKFNIGDPVIANGMDVSGLVVTAAVNHTAGNMYEVDNGNRGKWVAESFLTLNRDLYDPWCGTDPQVPKPIPLRGEEGGE